MGLNLKKMNLLVMPTDICNMNCIYCFHSAHHEKIGKMSLKTLKKLYDITFSEYSEVTIIWHGGEPLVMGLDFYKKAIKMQKEYDVIIKNRMQSNLTLLSDDMSKFLCDNNIGVGTSFDGCKNDLTRGFSKEIIEGRNKILKNGKQCGFIMVVSSKNIDNLIESYEYFKSIGANYTINTYVPNRNQKEDILKLNATHTIERIEEFFDYWIYDKECNIHIDYFERIINFLLTGKKGVCKYNSCLGKWVGIRYNGDIVPCNRYFPDKYSYGNVWDYNNLSSAFESSGFGNILSEAISRREKCKQCIAFPLCSGGCNNVAFNENGIDENGGDSCVIFREIYRYVIEKTIQYIKSTDKDNNKYNPIFISTLKKKQN
jgi:uncharacterized protein